MTTLRALLRAPPDPAVAAPWALFDDGRCVSQGVAPPQQWPGADLREIVLAADAVRIVAIDLPPMPANRRATAVAYALEDQLAGPRESHAIRLDESVPGKPTLARVASRSLVEALARAEPPFARVLAEPDLAEPIAGWRWCASDDGGFVRRADGTSFAVGPTPRDGELPPELAIALAQAGRAGTAPSAVDVEAPCDAAACARWSARHGIAFRPRKPWQWQASTAFARAPDLRTSLAADRPRPPARTVARLFVPALVIAMLALALHVVSTAGTWIARRVELAQAHRELAQIAAQAGLRDVAVDDAAAAIAREHAIRRHAAGLDAPADAVPMLARVVPALATLPDRALKSATYSGRAWTFELAPVDDANVSRVVQQIAAADLPVVHARGPTGARVRVGPAP